MKSLFSRAALSLWHHKRRNILITVWVFLLLFLLISVTLISIASGQQVDYLNANVGNCVMMTKTSDEVDGMEGPFYTKEAEQLKSLPFVRDCNMVSFGMGNLVDATPVVMDEEMYARVVEGSKTDGYTALDTSSLFGMINTETYTLFTSAGFTLAEGKHITADDAGEKVAVISSALAKKNGLKLGDSIGVTGSNGDKELSGDPGTLTLTIIGLFDYKYRCSTYTNQDKTACSFHSIREDELTALVLHDIRRLSELICVNRDEMLHVLLELNSRTKQNGHARLDRDIRSVQANMKDVSNRIDLLMDERMSGNVSDAMFKQMMAKYEAQQNELMSSLCELKAEQSVVKDDTENIRHLMERFEKCSYIEELTGIPYVI